jgi:hypothetical protein
LGGRTRPPPLKKSGWKAAFLLLMTKIIDTDDRCFVRKFVRFSISEVVLRYYYYYFISSMTKMTKEYI